MNSASSPPAPNDRRHARRATGIGKSPTLIETQNADDDGGDDAGSSTAAIVVPVAARRCTRPVPHATTMAVTARPASGRRTRKTNTGTADRPRDDADLHLARAGDHPADDVGAEQQHGSGQRATDHQPAVVRAADPARHVRDGEADEHDRSGAASPPRTAARSQTRRRRGRGRPLMPSPAAASSPRADGVERPGEEAMASASPTIDERRHVGGDRRGSAPPSEPTVQKRNWSSVATSSSRIAVRVKANSSAVSGAPARASCTGVAPSRPERAEGVHDHRTPTAAPAKANHTRPEQRRHVERRRSPARPTNRAAPALTPRMPGSASGLRVTPCMTAPPTPSAAPTSRPTIVRGMRSARTMRWSVLVRS